MRESPWWRVGWVAGWWLLDKAIVLTLLIVVPWQVWFFLACFVGTLGLFAHLDQNQM